MHFTYADVCGKNLMSVLGTKDPLSFFHTPIMMASLHFFFAVVYSYLFMFNLRLRLFLIASPHTAPSPSML